MTQVDGTRTHPGHVWKVRGNPCAHQGPDDDLAFAPYVYDVRAKGDADSRTDEEQGRGFDEGLGETEFRCPPPR